MPRTYLTDTKFISDNTDEDLTEPVTVAEVKTFLQLEGTAYDGPLALFITAARKKVEQYCNVSLVPKEIFLSFNTVGISPMRLRYPPMDEITSVEYNGCDCGSYDVLVLDTGYYLQNDEAYAFDVVSTEVGKHRIKYTTLASDVTAYKQAVIAQAAHIYTFRDDATAPEWSPVAKALIEDLRNIVL